MDKFYSIPFYIILLMSVVVYIKAYVIFASVQSLNGGRPHPEKAPTSKLPQINRIIFQFYKKKTE